MELIRKAMGRILALDYGLKRVGIAVTDPMKIIASPITTVDEGHIVEYLWEYMLNENVETIVVGMPKRLNGKATHATGAVIKFVAKLKKTFPEVNIVTENEQFTSKMAVAAMITGGMKKKERMRKSNIDKISASIILQSYLERMKYNDR